MHSFTNATRLVLLLVAGGLGATALSAQDTTRTKRDTANVAAVVVTATRSARTLEQMSLHTSIITRETISRSPARTLDQLLRDIPGFNLPGAPFNVTDPTGQQTRMRGVTNSKVLMLVDGVPVHDPFFSTTQWFKVPLSSIERVEVIRGGASSTWGSMAVAGVVNIITRKPFDTAGQLDVSYQSFNSTTAALSKNFQLGNGFGLRVSGDVLDTDGYQTTPEEYLSAFPGKTATPTRNYNAQAALYYTPSEERSAFVRAGYHQQNQVIGGYEYGRNLQKGPDAAAGFTQHFGAHDRVDVRGWTQYIDFDKYNGAACYLASATSCNATATTSPLVQYANSHDDNPYRELGGSAVYSRQAASRWMTGLQAGLDYRRIGGEDSAVTYNRPTTTSASSATINRTNRGRGTQQFVGAFTQLTSAPFPNLTTTLSVRLDGWTNSNGISEMTPYRNGVAQPTQGGAIDDSHLSSLNPSITARYALGTHVALRGGAYRAFRAPGLNNLYRSFSSTTSITIANPELDPETLIGGEAGIDAHVGALSTGLTWFRYDTKDLIASYRIPNAASAPPAVIDICGPTLSNCPASVNFNTNGQDARSQGIELTADWRIAAPVSVDAGYTYTDSRYVAVTTTDPVNKQLGAIPRNLVTLGTTWNVTNAWNIRASARHTDKMYLDVSHTIPQEAFTLVNFSTSWRARQRLELYASATNVGNVVYSDNGTTSASGKTLGQGLSITTGVRVGF